jgi:exodeoxyribonuclease VIII
MKDVMLDLETFGIGPNACVVQIGACYFDRETGELGESFKANIDARSAVKNGAVIDADTVYWWLKQSKEAIASITTEPQTPNSMEFDVFYALNIFLEGAKYVWSHATFDFVIVTNTLRRLSIKPSFKYTAARDIRTLVDLAGIGKMQNREGIHHDALDDCKFQVAYCVEALNKLRSSI